jgi:hypothetical protein
MPGLCAFDRPVCARFVAAFIRQIEGLKHQPHFKNIYDAMIRDGCALTFQEGETPGTSLAFDYFLENGMHRLAKMDQGLRLGMSDDGSITTFFAGLGERFQFLKKLEDWIARRGRGGADNDVGGGVQRRERPRADAAALEKLLGMESPLDPELDGDELHHMYSKIQPVSETEPDAPARMLAWKETGEEAAKTLFARRLPPDPSAHPFRGHVPSKITKAMLKGKDPDYYYSCICLWSPIARMKVPWFGSVASQFGKKGKATMRKSVKEWQKVWRQVIGKILNGESIEMKVTLATSPVLPICIPLADPQTGAVRSGVKIDMLGNVLSPNPSSILPDAEGRSGFGAIIVDFSAVLVRVCATLKKAVAAEKKTDKSAACTWGRVVDAALSFVMRRMRAVKATSVYLCVDPYATDEEESKSVKRWAHVKRGSGDLSARKYEHLNMSTVVAGGAGKVMAALTVPSNKRLLKELVYFRAHELGTGTEFLHPGEILVWVSSTAGYGDKAGNTNQWVRLAQPLAAGDSSAAPPGEARTVPELLSRSSEADFKFGLAVQHWVDTGKDTRPISVWVEDTDVITFVITQFWRRCVRVLGAATEKLDVAFMREKKGSTTYQHISAIVDHVRAEYGEVTAELLLDNLHHAHVISGCDYTSFLAGIKKKSFWKTLVAMAGSDRLRATLRNGLGRLNDKDATHVIDGVRRVKAAIMTNIEVLWACLYLPSTALNKVVRSGEEAELPTLGRARTLCPAMEADAFPISLDELEQHVLRTTYVIWQFVAGSDPTVEHIPDAPGWGWYVDGDGYLQIQWSTGVTMATRVGVGKGTGRKKTGSAKAKAATSGGSAASESAAAAIVIRDEDNEEDNDCEEDEEDGDEFWGDDAGLTVLDNGIPAGVVPVCNTAVDVGTVLAFLREDGEGEFVWKAGEVTRKTMTGFTLTFEDSTTMSGRAREDLKQDEYGVSWVELDQ